MPSQKFALRGGYGSILGWCVGVSFWTPFPLALQPVMATGVGTRQSSVPGSHMSFVTKDVLAVRPAFIVSLALMHAAHFTCRAGILHKCLTLKDSYSTISFKCGGGRNALVEYMRANSPQA
jgi:hypothetical protein|mmetsp:Transcript_76031/g.126671  ORF Transcript_76031/g.126671 Transcript_76031/m.126671 type:complete len:121 (+) Transcript_76031:1960-2322(+)